MNKKTTLFIVAVLCLTLSAMASHRADTIRPLTVGDTVPDLPLGNRHLSDYKNQLVILDFWATWCSPCIAMLPKMDSLQRAFEGQLQVVAVTYQPDSVAEPFLERHAQQRGTRYGFAQVTDDMRLAATFPHRSLPHYVWLRVDACGMATVQAITGYQQVNAQHIAQSINGEIMLPTKDDGKRYDYDRQTPLFSMRSNIGEPDTPIFYSILTPYKEGLGGGMFHNVTLPGDTIPIRRITLYNYNITKLYQLAYGGYRPYGLNRTVFDVGDPGKLWSHASSQAYKQWLREGNGYCFEMVLPAHMAPQAFPMMRQQLDAHFPQYHVYVDSSERDCLVLHRTSDATPFATKGGARNQEFDYTGCTMTNRPWGLQLLARYLGDLYLQLLPTPVVDETDYTGAIDLVIDAPLTDVKSINTALAKYDLALTVKRRKISVLVIQDKEAQP